MIIVAATGLDARMTLRWRAEAVAARRPPRAVFRPADAVAASPSRSAGCARPWNWRRRWTSRRASCGPRPARATARRGRLALRAAGRPGADPQPAPAARRALAALPATASCGSGGGGGDVLADLLDPGPADLTAPPAPPSALVGQLAGIDAATVEAAATHFAGVDGLRDWTSCTGSPTCSTWSAGSPCRSRACPALLTTPRRGRRRGPRRAPRALRRAAWASVVRPVHDVLRRAPATPWSAGCCTVGTPTPTSPTPTVTGGYVSPDQLFETLLIDVSMDPCTRRPASSQRSPRCSCSSLAACSTSSPTSSRTRSTRSAGRRCGRYRVWEANRKVFLFPENWLDPELRDDKSPFFRDVESELLQSDITDQARRDCAGPLPGEARRRREPRDRGLHVEERVAAPGRARPVVHVVGRTAGAKRGYYHRVLDGTWQAWEQVTVDVQDDPVLPVMWKGRFLLFWLKIAKQPDPHNRALSRARSRPTPGWGTWPSATSPSGRRPTSPSACSGASTTTAGGSAPHVRPRSPDRPRRPVRRHGRPVAAAAGLTDRDRPERGARQPRDHRPQPGAGGLGQLALPALHHPHPAGAGPGRLRLGAPGFPADRQFSGAARSL